MPKILNDRIRDNPRIKGIQLGTETIKSIQFADDLNRPLLFDQETLSEVLKELQDFKAQVGLAINISKSCIYRIGTISNSTVLLNGGGIPWVSDGLSVLGITITANDSFQNVNIDPLIDKNAGSPKHVEV